MESIKEVYDNYAKLVYHYIFSITRDKELSEEIMQETFVIAINQINKIREDCKISVWLWKIAKNVLYKETHKNKIKTIPIEELELFDDNNIEDIVIENEQKRRLYKAIDKLDTSTREVMYLRLEGNMSFREIGRILNKTENWVRVTFFRGKQKINEGLLMMNKKDCKIIQDLLPSYSDGITSQETNNYIEDHLKNCAECKNILKNMNKEIEPNETIDQAKELKYLRGFKNRRNIMVVLSIILTICLCVGVLLVRIPLNPDRFNVEWMYMENNELNIYLNTNYSNIVVTGEVESNEEKKEIVIKVKGGIPNGISGGNYGINANIDIDENTENIYIEGAFGKRKLIWSKNMNIMTKEEWERWYIEEYIPEQLEKTQGIYYEDIKGKKQWIATPEWNLIYEKIFKE